MNFVGIYWKKSVWEMLIMYRKCRKEFCEFFADKAIYVYEEDDVLVIKTHSPHPQIYNRVYCFAWCSDS